MMKMRRITDAEIKQVFKLIERLEKKEHIDDHESWLLKFMGLTCETLLDNCADKNENLLTMNEQITKGLELLKKQEGESNA